MGFDSSEPRDEHGMWTDGAVVTVTVAGPPGRDGRVSGEIQDKNGDKYVVYHTSREKTYEDEGTFHKHQFQVFEKDKFNLADAQRGRTNGEVNSTELHYHGDRVMDTQTDKAFQRRGIASALYDHIEKVTGTKLNEQWAQTTAGKALWASRKKGAK